MRTVSTLIVGSLFLAGCGGSSNPVITITDPAPVNRAAPPAGRSELMQAVTLESAQPRTAVDIPVPPGVRREAVMAPTDPDRMINAVMPLDDLLAFARSHPLPPALQPVDVKDVDAPPMLARYVQARMAVEEGRHADALELLQAIVTKNPNDVDVLRTYARCLLALWRRNDAEQVYVRIVTLDPADAEALYMVATSGMGRDIDTAFTLLARARDAARADANPDPALVSLIDLRLAQLAFDQGYDIAGAAAAESALQLNPEYVQSTHVAFDAIGAFRQFPVLRVHMGDVLCKQRRFADAARQYDMAMPPGNAVPRELVARQLYALLADGRPVAAQQALLNAFEQVNGELVDVDVLLAEYLANNVESTEILAGAMRESFGDPPADDVAVRVLARLVPADESLQLRTEYALQHVDDDAVWPALLRGLASDDPARGRELARAIVRQRPECASIAGRHLATVSPRPTEWLRVLNGSDEADVLLGTGVDLYLGRLGEAWRRISAATERSPKSVALRRMRLEVAGVLAEPALVSSCIAAFSSDELQNPATLIAAMAASRSIGRADMARDLMKLYKGVPNAGVLSEAAVCAVAWARVINDSDAKKMYAILADDFAHRALDLDPADERAAEALVSIYREDGPLADADRYRDALIQIRMDNPSGGVATEIRIAELLQGNRWEFALREAQRAHRVDPTELRPLALMVEAWAAGDALDEGIEWFDAQIAERGNDPVLRSAWVAVYRRADRSAEVVDVLRAASDDEPEHRVLRLLLQIASTQIGDADSAVQLAEERMRSLPAGPQRALSFATVAAAVQRFDEVVLALDTVAADDRANTPLRLNAITLGKALPDSVTGRDAVLVRLADATVNGLDAVDVFPNVDTAFGVGMLARARINPDDPELVRLGQEYAVQMYRIDRPARREVLHWQVVAQHLLNVNRAEVASRLLRTRITAGVRTPTDVFLTLAMMNFAVDAVVGEVESTLDVLQQFDADGTLPATSNGRTVTLADMLYEVSRMYSLVGDEAGYAKLLEVLLSFEPDHAMALNNLGYSVLTTQNDPGRAWRWIEHAYALEPASSSILDSMAWLRYRQGRIEDDLSGPGATSLMQAALDGMDDPGPEVLEHAADIAWRIGKHDEALRIWRAILDTLDADGARAEMEANIRGMQLQGWGILVADPAAVYDRNLGRVRERVEARLRAGEAGEEPPLTPTMAGP
ncbi:MAG: tetratricopeptide repeat protein [Phycisphaerales bacterium]|nr:tetratricopeptide repeat protein [Phycisphaerales bacterium]